jgi:outer membrane cobalamin receptor
MRGFEFNLNLFYKRYLTASLGYTYLDAQDRSPGRTDNTLPYKIKHSFNFNSDAMLGRFSVNFNGRYNSKIRKVSIYPGSEPGAYTVLNAKIGYKFYRNQTVYLAVNNLTDTQYEEIERYRMPNRSFTLGTTLEF